MNSNNLIIRILLESDYITYLNFVKDIIVENNFTLTHKDGFIYTSKEKDYIISI